MYYSQRDVEKGRSHVWEDDQLDKAELIQEFFGMGLGERTPAELVNEL